MEEKELNNKIMKGEVETFEKEEKEDIKEIQVEEEIINPYLIRLKRPPIEEPVVPTHKPKSFLEHFYAYSGGNDIDLEDFTHTDYIEVDGGGVLTVAKQKITGVAVPGNADAYIYKDFGVGHFNKLKVYFEVYMDSGTTVPGEGGLAITNTIADASGLAATDIWIYFHRSAGAPNWRIILSRGFNVVSDMYACSADTLYYCLIEREKNNDTVTLKIYSNEARTTLLDTLIVSGFGTTSWRYFFPFININDAGGGTWDGYIENTWWSKFYFYLNNSWRQII